MEKISHAWFKIIKGSILRKALQKHMTSAINNTKKWHTKSKIHFTSGV